MYTKAELDVTIASCLPSNYNFEIYKTLNRIEKVNAKHVALQFPEGLLRYATSIANIIRHYTEFEIPAKFGEVSSFTDRTIDVTILGDVTYGACCIDDLTSQALGVDLLVHYGHSCLVPLTETVIPCLYVFVDIWFDPSHLVSSIILNFPHRLPLIDQIVNNSSIAKSISPYNSTDKEYCDFSICHNNKSTNDDITSCQINRPPITSAIIDSKTRDTSPQYLITANNASDKHDQHAANDASDKHDQHAANDASDKHDNYAANNASDKHDKYAVDVPLTQTCTFDTMCCEIPVPCTSSSLYPQYIGRPNIALLGTIQFNKVLHAAEELLSNDPLANLNVMVPQRRPLISGEVLGCTSPKLKDFVCNSSTQHIIEANPSPVTGASSPLSLCVFISDGRFHLESAMVHNPHVPFYRYDPFTKVLCRELMDIQRFHSLRRQAIATARRASVVGLILGTLGRQGAVGILERIENILKQSGIDYVILLMSELLPNKLAAMSWCSAFIQVACPRLSIDWGHHFSVPLLNSYEAFVAFGDQTYKNVYPMDYYASDGAIWSNYYNGNRIGSLTPCRSRADILRHRLNEFRSKGKQT